MSKKGSKKEKFFDKKIPSAFLQKGLIRIHLTDYYFLRNQELQWCFPVHYFSSLWVLREPQA